MVNVAANGHEVTLQAARDVSDIVRPVYATDDCEIDLARRELRILGLPIPVGGRAFEIIEVLAESAGELVSKDELMDRIWPGAIVMENTLRVHTGAVRKALGPYRHLLKTESGRGYRLLGSWAVRHQDAVRPPSGLQRVSLSDAAPATNIPAAVTRLVGRAIATQRLRDLVSAYRVVTLTGPGGIGKTTLALEVARGVLGDFAEGLWLVELASLSDPDLVPSAVASVLGLKIGGETISGESIARAIGEQHLLLLLDNCEHLIDAVANLTEVLVRQCPRITILATSREILRIDGEYVYRVPPLEVPDAAAADPDHILGHSAVELFVTRTQALESDFAPRAEGLPTIAAICRRLDGIPLAIEFAAARAATLGIQPVAVGLGDRLALLTGGRRTALPRHRTLRAVLDWSHELLPETERLLLRRLAVFVGGFTLEATQSVAVGPADTMDVVGAVANLVAKSLISVNAQSETPLYRLLDTTRAYALEKLAESGELESTARRHAAYYRGLLERAGAEAETRPLPDWLATYGRQIDNVRKALDWVFSPDGDATLGVALTVVALPLWMHYSLMSECRSRVEQALSALPTGPARDQRLEMQLCHALGAVLLNIDTSVSVMESALNTALAIADTLDETDYRLRVLWCLWCHALNRGTFREALALADQFSEVATKSPDPVDPLTGVRMRGIVFHFLGDQDQARQLIEYMLTRYVAPVHRAHIIRFQFDQLITVRNFHVQILWLQGFVDQSLQMNQVNVADAVAFDHTMTLCNALTKCACRVSLLANDLPAAERFIDMLLARTVRDGLPMWHAWGTCFRAILLIKQGSIGSGLALLQSTLDALPPNRFSLRYTWVLGEYAAGLGQANRIADGLRVIDEALALSERDEELWCLPDLLRIKGDLVIAAGGTAAGPHAEALFLRSIDVAHRQKTLSWELRAAIRLARWQQSQGRHAEAHQRLAAVYGRFTEGFTTPDLREAKRLIDALS